VGHIVCSGASGVRNVEPLFFMLGWVWCGSHEKCAGAHYIELVILYLVSSTSHVVHSGASGAQNVDTPFFMLGLARCGPHNKRTGTRYAECVFLHPM
jgi:hypothetical protein